MDLLHGNIDADIEVGNAAPPPFSAFHAGIAQKVFSYGNDQTVVFGQRDKRIGLDKPLDRIIPAQQRFRPNPSLCGEIDDGLVEDDKFAAAALRASCAAPFPIG